MQLSDDHTIAVALTHLRDTLDKVLKNYKDNGKFSQDDVASAIGGIIVTLERLDGDGIHSSDGNTHNDIN